jgi:hypothetical protein
MIANGLLAFPGELFFFFFFFSPLLFFHLHFLPISGLRLMMAGKMAEVRQRDVQTETEVWFLWIYESECMLT